MSSSHSITKRWEFAALVCLPICLLALLSVGRGQNPPQAPPKPPSQDQSDVLRVYTELVQTDVMVFDKQGRFVNGLKGSDFELRIDGKPKQVEFFEKITTGSLNEESQLAAARGSSARLEGNKSIGPAPLDRGRPIFFYVDDLHLDLASLATTRKLIAHFIDNEMGQNDEAAIASASGQIGFLQQLTDNKSVLRAALERLKFRSYQVKDYDRPSMSEYQAGLITNYDADLTNYFVDETLKQNPGMMRDTAAAIVSTRARNLVQQGNSVSTNSLAGLESLIRMANKLPGRKLVFFISGGFFLDSRFTDTRDKLQRITSAAARSSVVIYSMDARGLVATLADASSDGGFDLSGRLARANSGELVASQDSLNALAKDTGGKTVFNTNALEPGLGRALKETSTYYLLAWKPDGDAAHSSKFRRIEVKVAGRPELTVQVRRGFFDREPEAASAAKTDKTGNAKNAGESVKSAEAELRKVIVAPYPDRDIPVSMSLNFIDTPGKGPLLSAALQIPQEFLSFVEGNGKKTALVAVAGSVYDDKGRPGATFADRITIAAPSVDIPGSEENLTYRYPVYVRPGLYQVRAGVRDERTGRSGTAHGWIQIPDLASGQLALSSLLMGVRTQPEISEVPTTAENLRPVELSVAHHFSPNGYLRFQVIVYNAALAPADSKPDVAIQVQLVRDEQPVVTTALKKVSAAEPPDVRRIPYAAEISLIGLPAGRYVLHVTVVDRVAKKSATQQTRFDIE